MLLFSKTFLGGNLGLGFDIGMTYHITPQVEFTGSLLDIGFINYSKDVVQYRAEGDFIFDGIKNLNGFDIRVNSNYNLMSSIPDYGATIELVSTF